jgi:hypothetical protein
MHHGSQRLADRDVAIYGNWGALFEIGHYNECAILGVTARDTAGRR